MNWKRTLKILWVANFIMTSGGSQVAPFLPLYIEQLGISRSTDIVRWSGWIFSSLFFTSAIFQPIWGRLADRYGRKIMLLRAGIGGGIITALMGTVSSVGQLFFLRMLNGVFSGFVGMSISLQASITPDEEAGRALGTLQTGAIAGNLIGPLIGGMLADTLGVRYVFFLTGGLLIIASLIVVALVHEKKETEVTHVKAMDIKRIMGDFVQMKPLIPIFAAAAVTQVGMMSIEPIVSIHVKTLYTGTHLAMAAGLVVAMSGIGNLIGAPTLGRLCDKIGQWKVLILSLVAASFMYVPQALAKSMIVLLAGRFMLGLFIGGMQPSLNVLVKIKAPKKLMATAFGFYSSSTFLGNFIGPLIGSSVAAAYAVRNVFFVTMGILLLNALMVFLNRGLSTHTGGDD